MGDEADRLIDIFTDPFFDDFAELHTSESQGIVSCAHCGRPNCYWVDVGWDDFRLFEDGDVHICPIIPLD